jgi:hypothetical protein
MRIFPLIVIGALHSIGLLGCSEPLLNLPCYDLPGTPETCDSEEPNKPNQVIQIEWECIDCTSIRQGFAPLVLSFWVAGIKPNSDPPILREIRGLNAKSLEKEFTKATERLEFTFDSEGVYAISATYLKTTFEPIEVRVDVNDTEAQWSTPWIRGELCDARIHMLADPDVE